MVTTGGRRDAHRKAVQPVAAPRNIARLERRIRERGIETLEGLPFGEVFQWVGGVSIELSAGMLEMLFGFPWEERRKPRRWSDIACEDERRAGLLESPGRSFESWKRREAQVGRRLDFAAAPADSEETRGIAALEYLGTAILLIIEGKRNRPNADPQRRRRAERVPAAVPETAQRLEADPDPGERGRPLASAACVRAANREARPGSRGQDDPQGRQGGDGVGVGRFRRGRVRRAERASCRSQESSTAASARARPALLQRQPPGRDAAARPFAGAR